MPGSLTRTKNVKVAASLAFFLGRPVAVNASLRRLGATRTIAIRRSFNTGPERHIPLKLSLRGNRPVAMSTALTIRRTRTVGTSARLHGVRQRSVPILVRLVNQPARVVPFGLSARRYLFRFVTIRVAVSKPRVERHVPLMRSFRKTRQRMLPMEAQFRLRGRTVPIYVQFVVRSGWVPIRARFRQPRSRTLPCVGRFA